MKQIRMLLIVDNRLLREGLTAMLKQERDIKVVATAAKSSVFTFRRLKPRVILVDLGMRSHNSLRVVGMLKKAYPAAEVIVMDLAPVQGDIMQFVQAGATGFVLKDATHDDFLMTIRSVAGGEVVIPPTHSESLFSRIVKHALAAGKPNVRSALRMTGREQDVVVLLANGLSNTEIGRKLNLSADMVRSHAHNIMEKLALRARMDSHD